MDAWGEMEMVGTIMDRDIEMVPCETLELNVPAEAEIVVEAHVNLKDRFKVGEVTSPSMYHLPHYEDLPEVEITAITMRADRPIYRNHQTCPDTDHQTLPRLCHEAVLYNRLSEIGLTKCFLRMTLSNLRDSTNAMWSNCEIADDVLHIFHPEFMHPSAIQIHQEL